MSSPQGMSNPLQGPANVYHDTYPAIDPLQWDLTGKAVLIAGASRGIGQATARSFASAGASYIAIGARSSLSATQSIVEAAAREAQRPVPQVLCLHLDVTDRLSVEAAAESISESFPRIDYLIPCAGCVGSKSMIGDSDPDVWIRDVQVNLFGTYQVCRAFVPSLLRSESPVIVAVASVAAHWTNPGVSAFKVAKLAVLRLMEQMSIEYGANGLVAFSVHPGNILTSIVEDDPELPPGYKEFFTETVELAADTMVYLCKEKREWLAGRYINCTWDMTELFGEKAIAEIVDGDKLKIKLAL